MDDKTIIDITDLNAEKHVENAAKRVDAYSEKLRHHASILSEKEYQKFLLERLEKDNGYIIRKASNFDRYFAVDREMLFKFLEDTQHETMDYLRKIYKSDLEETIINFINAETTKTRGSLLDVLKHGIEISNQKLELMYTKPATTLFGNTVKTKLEFLKKALFQSLPIGRRNVGKMCSRRTLRTIRNEQSSAVFQRRDSAHKPIAMVRIGIGRNIFQTGIAYKPLCRTRYCLLLRRWIGHLDYS